MSIDTATLAARLKEARVAADLTQEQVAVALDLPLTALVQIESGDRAVSTLELSKLADCYSQTISSFFEEAPLAQEQDVLVSPLRAALKSRSIVSNAEFSEIRDNESFDRKYLELLQVIDDADGHDPRTLDPEIVNQVVHLALEAFRREEISRGKLHDLSKLLNIPLQELLSLADTL